MLTIVAIDSAGIVHNQIMGRADLSQIFLQDLLTASHQLWVYVFVFNPSLIVMMVMVIIVCLFVIILHLAAGGQGISQSYFLLTSSVI